MSAAPAPLLSLHNVDFGYGKDIVLRNISLDIHEGEFIGLIGPNGSGKTTLFRGLLGLVPPRAGRLTRGTTKEKRIGYIPQREQLDPIYPLTASDVVRMGLVGVLPWYRFLDRNDERSIQEALERVGAGALAHASFAELSGGQRQRVLIARALAMDASLLVLDEPTAGIDPQTEENILGILAELHRQGKTILMVSHREQALKRYAKRMIEVKDQKVILVS